MKPYDIINNNLGVLTIGAYVGERFYDLCDKLEINNEMFNWTIMTLPEFFVGTIGMRLGNYLMKKISNNYLTRNIVTGGVIMSIGMLHELNNNGGFNDDSDVIKLGVGIGLSALINLYYDGVKK